MKKRIEFPLLELTLIIILFSMLALVAIPKWIDIGTEARIQTLSTIAVNLSSVNRMLYGRSVVKSVHNNALQATDILGEEDAGGYLVYGELRAQADDLKMFLNNSYISYSDTNHAGEVRLYLDNYKNEACYINYQQAKKVMKPDGQLFLQQARYRINSKGC